MKKEEEDTVSVNWYISPSARWMSAFCCTIRGYAPLSVVQFYYHGWLRVPTDEKKEAVLGVNERLHVKLFSSSVWYLLSDSIPGLPGSRAIARDRQQVGH